MLSQELYPQIKDYVKRDDFKERFLPPKDHIIDVKFLAQGEYNLNYLLETDKKKYVFRVNIASQMNLTNQIKYEYQALTLLSKSGVTPKPFFLDDTKKIIPYGLLIMEYLPGEPLDYRTDLLKAADTFARIHSLEFEDRETDFLVKETGPFTGIYNEASNLLKKFFQCSEADSRVKNMLLQVLQKAEEKKRNESFLLREPWTVVINTEVNSHNFIVDKEKQSCHLIDWEKPILGEPAQDLSMFLISTTTRWKRNYVLSTVEEEEFLKEYLKRIRSSPSQKDSLRDRVEMFKFFNYLRAISWCAMAWTEYTKPGRPLFNKDTLEKILAYIEIDFIRSCFPEVFKE